jgi:hypothetical protein
MSATEQKLKLISVLAVALLSGCDKYRQVDRSILCDPMTNKAYMVEQGSGAISFISPNPKYNGLCAPTGATHD